MSDEFNDDPSGWPMVHQTPHNMKEIRSGLERKARNQQEGTEDSPRSSVPCFSVSGKNLQQS